VATAAIRRDKGRRVLAITAIAFFLFVVNLSLFWTRWLIPFVPLYLTLVALAVQDIACLVARASGRTSIAVAAGVALCVGVFAAPLTTLKGWLTENRENTRTTVFNWIVAHVPEKSGILIEKGGPQLPCKKYKFWKVARNGAVAPLLSSRRFVPPTGIVGALADLRDIEVKGIDFIVLGQWYNRYKSDQERYVQKLSRYEELMRRYPIAFQSGSMRVLRVK
jgi:hypothetical protein